jgi:hypothetical protein
VRRPVCDCARRQALTALRPHLSSSGGGDSGAWSSRSLYLQHNGEFESAPDASRAGHGGGSCDCCADGTLAIEESGPTGSLVRSWAAVLMAPA